MDKVFNLVQKNKLNKIINFIKKKNLDINIRDNNNNYLVEYIILKNENKIFNYLLTKDLIIDFTNYNGKTIFYYIIKFNYIDILKSIIKSNKYNIYNISDSNNNIPLHYAIIMNNKQAFDLLIDNSDVNITDNNGNNSLFIAIINNSFNFIEKILKYNINLNILNKNNHSIIFLAILYNYINIEIFINKDKNFNLNIINDIYYSTPIMFSIVSNNNIITNILLKYNVDLNIQDNMGYTCFHYAIFNNNYNFFKNINKLDNINSLNIDNSTILHIIYNKYLYDNNRFNYPLELLIEKTNLNIKDKYDNTILHYLILSNDWIKFKNILSCKKNDIFILNYENKTVYDIMINDNKYDIFINIIASSFLYMYNLKKKKYLNYDNYTNEDIIKYIEKNKISKPIKKRKKNIILFYKKISYKCLSFTGVTIDILFTYLYLFNKFKNIFISITNNYIYNNNLISYINKNNSNINTEFQFMNFEIYFINNNIIFPSNFDNIIYSYFNSKKRFFIIPINIQINLDAHSNVLLYDNITNEIERFEPYSKYGPPVFNYNYKLLDKLLNTYLSIYFNNVKYIKPEDYIPNLNFMNYENTDRSKFIGEPEGYCNIWCYIYVYYRIKYINKIKRNKIINKIIYTIKKNNILYKNFVRFNSYKITNFRDKFINKINKNINDIYNNDITNNEFINLNQHIKNYIIKCNK